MSSGEDNTIDAVQAVADKHCGNSGGTIRFKQVRTHAGGVANIVANIVGDNCGVTRIVFRNTCFDFTDKIGADVGSFCEDTAADTGERTRWRWRQKRSC